MDSYFLNAMAMFACKHPSVQVFVPKYYYMGTNIFQVVGGGFFSKEHKCGCAIGQNEVDKGQYDYPFKVDYVFEPAFVVKTRFFEQVGLLDEGWQFGFEGPDLGKRAAIFGIETWYVPEAKVEHQGGGTMQIRNQALPTSNFKRFIENFNKPLSLSS